ncbi:MAG: 1-acyl-sn-glycerol-3-phosphate acyltransferase, partial [Myxococcales bacterium]|nr:1-acyl-sn-glycerol-3-phosphate acyltransferase [Myxococcales bacterium]
MITARKTQRFCRWFSRHCERRIATHFAEVRVHGLEQLRSVPAEVPLVVVSNHVSWWDPVLAIYLAHRVLGRDGYALMDAASLRRLRFFRRVGGFGVDLDDANDGAAAVRYAARLL